MLNRAVLLLDKADKRPMPLYGVLDAHRRCAFCRWPHSCHGGAQRLICSQETFFLDRFGSMTQPASPSATEHAAIGSVVRLQCDVAPAALFGAHQLGL